jgi:hydroxymethylpyrimidine synthase
MSALPESRYKVDAPELTERITRTPFAASSKIYVQGSRPTSACPCARSSWPIPPRCSAWKKSALRGL